MVKMYTASVVSLWVGKQRRKENNKNDYILKDQSLGDVGTQEGSNRDGVTDTVSDPSAIEKLLQPMARAVAVCKQLRVGHPSRNRIEAKYIDTTKSISSPSNGTEQWGWKQKRTVGGNRLRNLLESMGLIEHNTTGNGSQHACKYDTDANATSVHLVTRVVEQDDLSTRGSVDNVSNRVSQRI